MREKNGEDQVHQWRRSYDVRPPRESEEQREAYLKIVVINILITV